MARTAHRVMFTEKGSKDIKETILQGFRSGKNIRGYMNKYYPHIKVKKVRKVI